MQVIKVENKKKPQPLDWNCEIEDTARQRKRKHFRPLRTFFSELWGVRTITSTWGS